MAFLIDSLKEKFDFEDEDYDFEGYNYSVGNTSGMDVTQQIPSEIAERVGQLAQRGGTVMEIQIQNPTTFYIDREPLYNVVDGLGLNVSFHSDPNVGYTAAYKTGRGRGFDITHDYFTKYLQNFASFKKELEERPDYSFEIGRINPHISTDNLPALNERMADDVSLDPFGYTITEIDRNSWEARNARGKNLFKNEGFMKKMYNTFIKKRLMDEKYQLFGGRRLGYFSRYSPKFERIFKDAQRRILNGKYEEGVDLAESRDDKGLITKINLVAAGARDAGASGAWKEKVDEPLDEPIELEPADGQIEIEMRGNTQSVDIADIVEGNMQPLGLPSIPSEIERLNELDNLLGPNERVTRLASLSEAKYKIEKFDFESIDTRLNRSEALPNDVSYADLFTEKSKGRFKRKVKEELGEKLDDLWYGEDREDASPENFLISVQSKKNAVIRNLDIEREKILEEASDIPAEDFRSDGGKEWDLDEAAEAVLAGDEEFFEENGGEPEELHRELLDVLTGQSFENEFWKESNMFYFIIPAWMTSASESNEGHEGWEAPEFIWETIVERRWGDKYDLDLTDPDPEDGEGYFDALEQSREFRMDVAAASAAVYFWSHFTQVESHFEIEGNQYVDSDEGDYTWMEWMNEYGVGVNMEAMAGSPNEMFKLWRPKDMVTACRAVNITARDELEEIHEGLDGAIAKFTIDMEHTASFGVEPWEEMELLIEQEKWLADQDYNVRVDEEKPLAYIVRMYHLTKPGWETTQGNGHTHGPFRKGDVELYEWLYNMVDAGFTRNPGEEAYVMYEVGGEQAGTVYQAQLAMDLIELGVDPDELDPSKVDPDKEYEDEKEALMARFFGMDRPNFNREWAKIEEHAFDPLDGLLEAEGFDHTWSGSGAIESGGNRPNEWKEEEFK